MFAPPDPYRDIIPLGAAWQEEEVEVSTRLGDRELEAIIRSMLGACISVEEVRSVFLSRGLTVSEKRIYRVLRNLERSGEVVYRKRRWCPP